MARVSDNVLPDGAVLGLHLDRYSEVVGRIYGHQMCAFNGVSRPNEGTHDACISILTQSERDELAKYLYQAEERREEELGFFLSPKWITEEHTVPKDNPFVLRQKKLIEVGSPTYTEVEMGAVIDYGIAPFSTANPPTDPVEVDVTIAASVPLDEIIVTYPDELVRIYPTSKTRSGSTVTLKIPRCRLVKPEYNDDREDHISYYSSEPFLETVDVYRLWSDVSTGAQFVWYAAPCDTDCDPNCQSACPMIVGPMAHDLSIVSLKPASYSSGWTTTTWRYSQKPDAARFTYLSGDQGNLTNEIMTIRYAFTLMPRSPCNCEVINQIWEDGRKMQERGYRHITPYGMAQDAVETWLHDTRQKITDAGMFPGIEGY